MGQAVAAISRSTFITNSAAEVYKKTLFSQVDDCREYFIENYGISKMSLNKEEFDDVFSIMLDDVDVHFKMFDTFGRGKVNVFEVFAGAYMFSQEPLHGLDAKLDACFKLFDFDESNSLNEVEMELMFEAVLMGLSKISKISLPYASVVVQYVTQIFEEFNRDPNSGCVSLAELKQWLSGRPDMLTFLGNFMDARLICQMKQLVEEATLRALALFKEAATTEGGTGCNELSHDQTKKLLYELDGTPPTDKETTALIQLLASCGAGAKVSKEHFQAAIEPWLAFGVLDTDGSRSLDAEELKALMWIAEGIDTPEPFEKAVTSALVELDTDGNNTVDRLEWIQYNCVFDPTTGCVKPACQLRDEFEQLDVDKSGNISALEMEQILKKTMDALIEKAVEEGRKISQSSHNILRTMINNAASDLVDLMDSSGNGVVEWNEFRMHQRIVSERVKQLRDFVMHLVDQDEAEGIHEFEFRKGESMKVLTGLEQPLESQDIVSHHQQHPTSKTSKKPASSISAKSKAGKKTGTGTKTKTPSSPPKPTLNKKVA